MEIDGTIANRANGELHIWAHSMFEPDGSHLGMNTQMKATLQAKGTNQYSATAVKDLYSLGQWNAVKHWEIAQEFGLETQVSQILDSRGYPGEKRQWWARRQVFNVGPHMSVGIEASYQDATVIGDVNLDADTNHLGHLQYFHLTHQWYYLQMILNSGAREAAGHHIVDWDYERGFYTGMMQESGQYDLARGIVMAIKGMDEHDNNVGVANAWWGWNLRDATPDMAGLSVLAQDDSRLPILAQHSDVLEVLFRTWLDKNNTFSANAWDREPYAGVYIHPSTYVVANDADGVPERIQVMLRDVPISCALKHDIATWAATLWPMNDWQSFVKCTQ